MCIVTLAYHYTLDLLLTIGFYVIHKNFQNPTSGLEKELRNGCKLFNLSSSCTSQETFFMLACFVWHLGIAKTYVKTWIFAFDIKLCVYTAGNCNQKDLEAVRSAASFHKKDDQATCNVHTIKTNSRNDNS